MSDFELNIQVCNRFLNKIMKSDYGYDIFFRIHPLTYLNNRLSIPKTHHYSELVYLKTKMEFTLFEREKIRKELNRNINLLFKFTESRNYRPILDIKMRIT
jgi:hypothetical protein